MKKNACRIRGFALAVLLGIVCLCTATGSFAQEFEARALHQGNALGFDVQGPADWRGLVLNVSGNGVWLSREFGAGESAWFDLSDNDGNYLPDGNYTWELTVLPQAQDLNPRDFENDRSSLDGTEMRRSRHPNRLVASGYFTIAGGSLVREDLSEAGGVSPRASVPGGTAAAGADSGLVARDQIINDDLIVTRSACIGFDCVNGESFGFDTIRLKENNLRIKFLDTSVGAFPSADWQLTANASNSGGANKFSIDDISANRTPFTIEANAPNNSLYVDDGGRVGIGTSTPVVELHVKNGDTPTLRLEQDGSSGFGPQTWDVAGNETSFFVRDATNGSTLPFRIRPGASSSALDISADDEIGMGTASPQTSLHITTNTGGSNFTELRLQTTQGTGVPWDITSRDNGLFTINNGDQEGNIPFKIFGANAGTNSLVIRNGQVGIGTDNPTGKLEVNGTIVVTGTGQVHPDFVFADDYALESIEEHAELMWSKKHLPAVGPGRYTDDGKSILDVTSHNFGMLEELEKAHIYIERLNERLESFSSSMESKETELAELRARLADLESRLSPTE